MPIVQFNNLGGLIDPTKLLLLSTGRALISLVRSLEGFPQQMLMGLKKTVSLGCYYLSEFI